VCWPDARDVVVSDAVEQSGEEGARVLLPRGLAPSLKVTVPLGTPEPEIEEQTVAVKVTGPSSGSEGEVGEAASTVVVGVRTT
jgi:hypothetical protein